MSAETDLIKLYSTRILALASDIPHLGTLENPQAQAKRRSPLCGSTVSVGLTLQDGRIKDFAQDVKACALGQAAASVLGAQAVGLDLTQVTRGREQLVAMLKQAAPPPQAPFEGLEVLKPAADYKNRHDSILLAFDATIEAITEAQTAQCA